MKFAVLFGAKSFEHEISIVSAITIKQKLKSGMIFIFCDSNREFFLIDSNNMKSTYFSSLEYKKAKKLTLKKGGFFEKKLFGEHKIEFDVMLNLVHGGDGEDGKIAGMLDFFEISYIGPRREGSVISINKFLTKCFAKEIGVSVVDYELLRKGETKELKFPFPVIVKPLRLGSSIGVSIAKNVQEFDYALDVAFEFDDEVLVEPFISGVREFNLAGCMVFDNFCLSKIEEPQKGQFLDFDKKYLDFSRSGDVSEAIIDESLKNDLIEIFKKIYNPLFKGALIRCDFFLIDGKLYLNEINPIPGSLANYLFENYEEMILNLAKSLPHDKNIDINYLYINSIKASKHK